MNTSDILKQSGTAFGTSGARGLAVDFTSEVCQSYTHAFIDVIKKKYSFSKLAIGIDNRPESENIARRCAAALIDLGIETIYCGVLPTPALAFYAMECAIPCIMVTGSHIPFDRNGLKFYTPEGEITKKDEVNILQCDKSFSLSLSLPDFIKTNVAVERYISRYTDFLPKNVLKNKKIGIYEHSSAGRDIYPELFTRLGAEIISLERSDEFVPIDTEAVSHTDIEKARKWASMHHLDAIFSTDGDGDRPLVADENGEWLRGDILGLLCADALNIEMLAIPVSCNTAVELSGRFTKVTRTQIGSPFVIEEFNTLRAESSKIAGFEANGGFLLGSDIHMEGAILHALPTRDAVLPALVLFSASRDCSISSLVAKLPGRYTFSERVKDFPTETSTAIIARALLNPQTLIDDLGFSELLVASTDSTDGLRMTLNNGDIIHLRPSGNAPELRCYSESSDIDEAIKYVNQTLSKIVQLPL